jgi:hypothetical protein
VPNPDQPQSTDMPVQMPDHDPVGVEPGARSFYADCLRSLCRSGLPFLLGGTYALNVHTGLDRETKDVDVFCRPGDYPRILGHFAREGYQTTVEDPRWLAKVRRGVLFADIIFNASFGGAPITDVWFEHAVSARIHGSDVRVLSPTELIWSKALVQSRERYDGADVAHVILRRHDAVDWRRLLSHMDGYWEVLLAHLMLFRFVYPSEAGAIPAWLMKELLSRADQHRDLPTPLGRVCRGRILSRADYVVDVTEWGFADLGD